MSMVLLQVITAARHSPPGFVAMQESFSSHLLVAVDAIFNFFSIFQFSMDRTHLLVAVDAEHKGSAFLSIPGRHSLVAGDTTAPKKS